MISINEVVIFSVDANEDSLEIEGEIIFESDLSSVFSATYFNDGDEFETLELDVNPGKYDKSVLKEMILESVREYNE